MMRMSFFGFFVSPILYQGTTMQVICAFCDAIPSFVAVLFLQEHANHSEI
jgi:hypothetical protein